MCSSDPSVVSVCFGISSLLGAAILSAGKQPEKCGFKVAVRLFLLGLAMTALTVSYWLLVDRGNSVNGFLIVFSSGALMFGFLISYINIPMSTALMRIVDREMLSKGRKGWHPRTLDVDLDLDTNDGTNKKTDQQDDPYRIHA